MNPLAHLTRPRGLRLPRHRATTAQLCAVYPFHAEAGLGPRGVYLGTDVYAGGSAFCFDPFELYRAGVLTSPNMLIVGEVGAGKSSAVKTFLYRSVGQLRTPGGRRWWAAIVDPKGEYEPLADALGLDRVALHPGGTQRLNPLDPGPGTPDADELATRRTAMVTALTSAVLHRDLQPLEDAALGWTADHLSRHHPTPTLHDLAALLADPPPEIVAGAQIPQGELIRAAAPVRWALGKLLDRELRGLFDGPSTVTVDWHGRGLVLDLSAIHHDPDALTLVMIAATAWLQALMAAPDTDDTPQRVQVLEECWALLGAERTAKYLQSCWKLSRTYGVANIAVAHRISDLRAQADDGTATAKVATGLLADTQTRVLFRQSSDQVPDARTMLELTDIEAHQLPRLPKGHALWRVGDHAALVEHVIGAHETWICDTDQKFSA